MNDDISQTECVPNRLVTLHPIKLLAVLVAWLGGKDFPFVQYFGVMKLNTYSMYYRPLPQWVKVD